MSDTEGTDLGAGVGDEDLPCGEDGGEVGRRITDEINRDPDEVQRLREARKSAREGDTSPWEERVLAEPGAEERVQEMAEALLAAQLDAKELERWEVVPAVPDRMPPWDQYRIIPREMEMWITGEVHVWERGRDIPRDTPVPELRKRLERAMRKRGGVARVFEKDGRIHVYLSAQTPAWKGFSHERDEPLK
jgi:hypothetical protein